MNWWITAFLWFGEFYAFIYEGKKYCALFRVAVGGTENSHNYKKRKLFVCFNYLVKELLRVVSAVKLKPLFLLHMHTLLTIVKFLEIAFNSS